jgi:N-acetylneuraminate synthase
MQSDDRQDCTLRRALIIGEVAQAHDGSLGLAHAFIDAIARAGADAFKFQTHIASAESTRQEGWRTQFSVQDASRYDYWKRMEFSETEWRTLKVHANSVGLAFFSSPFSLEAVTLLESIGVDSWKVASGELSNWPLLERIAETQRPIFVSSGMSHLGELDEAVSRVKRAGAALTVLQCTSCYPCPPERVGLNLLASFRERYQCAVGLSDHSGTIYPALAASALGCDAVEVHVTLSREMFGPDVASSVTTDELRQLVEGVRFIERMQANPVDKNVWAATFDEMRRLFTRSVALRIPLSAGTILRSEHLTLKKPGTGIPADRLEELVGRRLRRSLGPEELVTEDDVEPDLIVS